VNLSAKEERDIPTPACQVIEGPRLGEASMDQPERRSDLRVTQSGHPAARSRGQAVDVRPQRLDEHQLGQLGQHGLLPGVWTIAGFDGGVQQASDSQLRADTGACTMCGNDANNGCEPDRASERPRRGTRAEQRVATRRR
jgi:hypothetical protein